MKPLALISCYFGPLPNTLPLWLKSCGTNPDTDWFLFTDQKVEAPPSNVHVIEMSLAEAGTRCRERIDPATILPKPYKLCDYKPLYGTLFSDHLQDYAFWGYCDLDVVFGRLSDFFTQERLDRYDKLLTLGHLSIYRNTPEVAGRVRAPGSRIPLEKVITDPRTCAFDEFNGIYSIYKANGFPMCEEVPFADISCLWKRFRLHTRSSKRYQRPAENHDHQLFYWENGELRRAWLDDRGDVREDSFLYIHLPRRRFPDPPVCDAFFCTPAGFLPKTPGKTPTAEEIRRLNPYPGRLYEWIERKIRRRAMKREDHRRFVRRKECGSSGS